MSEWGTTTRVRSLVTLANGEVYPGEIHLIDWVHHHAGPETPLEMLNRPEGFFPVTQESGTVFVPKNQVAMVTCEWPPPGWPPDGIVLVPDPDRRISLLVRLASGEELRGEAAMPLRAGHERALDYLNESGSFFQLVTEDVPRLINRAHVSVVRPLD
jgi:hypothetical protein